MKTKLWGLVFSLLIISIFFSSCFPTYKATRVFTDTLLVGDFVDVKTKLFTLDNTIYLFLNGFTKSETSIFGEARTIKIDSKLPGLRKIQIPLDSILAMITYGETTSGTRLFGSFLLGITGPPLTFLGIYCILCPKCCFGSCPTIYTYDGQNYNLEAELFSECISRQLENSDIDLLRQNIIDDTLKLKITNEALETHYINKFEIFTAEHPLGTKVFPSINDKLILVSNLSSAISAENKEGIDITGLLTYDDNKYYRSGIEKVSELKKGIVFDYIDIKLPSSPNNSTKLIMKYRNTLLSTTLFYDVVLGSQGVNGLNWTNRMNEDAVYAAQFKMIYETFSGIKLSILKNGVWKSISKFKDVGPLNWKYLSAEIPQSNHKEQSIRLEFIPDNFMIDYIGFDSTNLSDDKIETRIVYPSQIIDGSGAIVNEASEFMQSDDKSYLKTDPGDSYYLKYFIPSKENIEQTTFINSKGYYNEWVRGNWIRNENKNYTFDLYDIKGTLSYLADCWLENSTLLEEEFFNSRIILKEEK